MDHQVTLETQEQLVPMDHQDPLVCLVMMDEMERRDILDLRDPLDLP